MPIDVVPTEPIDTETITGEFLGISYDTEPDTMVLRLRVSAEDVKRTLSFVGGRGVLTLDRSEQTTRSIQKRIN